MGLDIYNEVKGTKIDVAFMKSIYKATLKHFGLKDVFDVEITITDEKTIQETNLATRNVDKVTDVLSFPTLQFKFPFVAQNYVDDISPDTGKILLGEIMLCEKRAKEQAIEYGHSFDREIGFLVLHGLLHLMGFDHMVPEEEKIMMGHAEEILKELKLVR